MQGAWLGELLWLRPLKKSLSEIDNPEIFIIFIDPGGPVSGFHQLAW